MDTVLFSSLAPALRYRDTRFTDLSMYLAATAAYGVGYAEIVDQGQQGFPGQLLGRDTVVLLLIFAFRPPPLPSPPTNQKPGTGDGLLFRGAFSDACLRCVSILRTC